MQILEAVYYCHQKNVIHRDLKLENVLFSNKEKLEIKVVDFGIAGYCHNNQGETTDMGTVKYMPPEVLSKKDTQASRAMDIWAWGIILYAMLFNKMPFTGQKPEVIRNICKKPVVFPKGENVPFVSQTVKDLILEMLAKDPIERITMIDLLEHKWFKMTAEEIEEEQKQAAAASM